MPFDKNTDGQKNKCSESDTGPVACKMKILDINAFEIVKTGVEFQIASNKECTAVADLLPDMERNEGAVFWLQPKNGSVEQQEACICVDGVFYALNSKFEKAIFRNVRLTRDFQNFERLVDGTRKLVIPRRLLSEKLRTSRRVCAVCDAVLLLMRCLSKFLTVFFLYFRRICLACRMQERQLASLLQM